MSAGQLPRVHLGEGPVPGPDAVKVPVALAALSRLPLVPLVRVREKLFLCVLEGLMSQREEKKIPSELISSGGC